MDERDVAMTPDGSELYFCRSVGSGHSFVTILVSKLVDGTWTPPEVAPFAGSYMDIEPCITADGSRFFFVSNRPLPDSDDELGNPDIWVMERQQEHWSEPKPLGPPISSPKDEYFPSVTRDGTIYFTREAADGAEAIHRSRLVDGTYQEPEVLPVQVNSGRGRFNAFVAPDESFLIVPVFGREDSLGGVDYYVVFRSQDDVFSEPVNLSVINHPVGAEWSASLSPDGHFLFFMSSRARISDRHSPSRLTAADLSSLHTQPMNGNSDIWWVDASIIEAVRPQHQGCRR